MHLLVQTSGTVFQYLNCPFTIALVIFPFLRLNEISAIGQIILEEESPVVVVSIKLPAVHTVNQGPGGVRALHPTLQHLQNMEGSGLSTPLSNIFRTWRGQGSPPYTLQHL